MKKYIIKSILLTSLLVISINTAAQDTHTNMRAWENVDQLIEENLPESALKVLDSISHITESSNDQLEKIKVRL